MSKGMRNLLIVACVFILVGSILGGAGYSLGGFNSVSFTTRGPVVIRPGYSQYIQVDSAWETLTDVDIDVDVLDLNLVEGPSGGGFQLIGTYNASYSTYYMDDSNGKLTVKISSDEMSGFIGFGFMEPDPTHLTLIYPAGTHFNTVKLNNDVGSLTVNNLNVSALAINLAVGSFSGSAITADTLTADLAMGSFTANNLVVKSFAELQLAMGALDISSSQIKNLEAECAMGSMTYTGTLSGKAVLAVDMGSIDMNLDTDEKNISFDISTNMGSTNINGKGYTGNVRLSASSPSLELDVSANLGSVDIKTRM
ncbi:MAG: DUF4097 domain-containing protein [Coriobacteriales bacterium]|jgi:hypothetical protein|nr:DUF4097 domain-containing protein [Coriobacteriales bacterium]